MKVVIDTSSLLSLVRYYLPFDEQNVIFGFFKTKLEGGEFIIIDAVLEECKYVSNGDVVDKLSFLKTNKIIYKTSDLVVPNPKQFYHYLDNNFVNSLVKKKLNEEEFEKQKEDFINSADLKQVILCLNLVQKREDVILVTEETANSNDNKLFQKIPLICKELNIETLTLPKLLDKNKEINIKYSLQSIIDESKLF